MEGIKIIGYGHALPEKIVSNEDLSKMVDTSDEWISSRTGIKNRYVSEQETNAGLSLAAAKEAIADSGKKEEDLDLILLATVTPDYVTPSVACRVAAELSVKKEIPVFDFNAACSGFLYGLYLADRLLKVGQCALLMATEQLSKITDFTDRSTCVLFGDGSGAVVVEKKKEVSFDCFVGADGNAEPLYCMSLRFTEDAYIHMNGKEVFRFAVDKIQKSIARILEQNHLTIDDIDYVVCHQANYRIIDYVRKKLHAPEEKFFCNIQNYANTSAASIPLALYDMRQQGLLCQGKKVIVVGFGGGFTWGAALLDC